MDPFQQMSDWKRNMDHFFGEQFWDQFEGILKPTIPQINLYQTDNEILCIANIPGLTDLEKLNIYVDYATLELRGVIDIGNSKGNVVKEEILQGVFERTITLPFPVRSDRIRATYNHGLVYIQLHRFISEASQKNEIRVQFLE